MEWWRIRFYEGGAFRFEFDVLLREHGDRGLPRGGVGGVAASRGDFQEQQYRREGYR